MSNALAIAAVTSTVRYVLDLAMAPEPGSVGGAKVTTLRPDRLASTGAPGEAAAGINVFLYQVTPNHAWNLTDLPTRRQDGSLVNRPIAALDLHYLITCYGDDEKLDGQRLLGRAVLALAVTPVLTRDLVAQALTELGDNSDTSFLLASDLAEQVELVKLSPTPLSLEDQSKLWGIFQTPYLLSQTYSATVVLLQGDVPTRNALPVRQRAVSVAPTGTARIAAVDADPPESVVTAGTTLVITGSGLLGPVTRVRVGPTELDPDADATAARLVVTLTDAVPAGVQAITVVHRSPPGPGGVPPERVVGTSNALPILVRPAITVAGQDADSVTLTVSPPIRAGQHGVVSLGRLTGGAVGDPDSLSFALPTLPPGAPPQGTVTLDAAAIGPGSWLVRVDIDGALSVPSLVGDTYGAPAVIIP